MTDQEKTIALAEFEGWKLDDSSAHKHCGIKWIPPSGSYIASPWWETKEQAWVYATKSMTPRLPNYLDDLNAVAQLEKKFWPVNSRKWNTYIDRLLETTHDSEESPVCATARQRSDAILKVLGRL